MSRKQVELNEVTLSFAPVRHYVEAYAVRVRSQSATLAYSGDSAPCESLVHLARDSDLFLCEASLAANEEPEPRGHSSAREAGEMAAAAGALALALTHYPAEQSTDALRENAARAYAGPITVVDDGTELGITRG